MSPFGNQGAGSSPFAAKPTNQIKPYSSGGGSPFSPSNTQDLKSPDGLFGLAEQAGLGEQANKMLNKSGGESQKLYSGGFVMDVMDTLNIFSYGMVGMVTGKGFAKGVETRASLSDEDALGQYGFAGKLAGFAGDILLDPLTYVSPWKIVSKIPGITSALEKVGNKTLGELTEIEVEGQKTFKREGGWTPLTFFADKLVYGFAASKEFLTGVERVAGRNDAIFGEADNLMKTMSSLDPQVLQRTLVRDGTGRIASKKLPDLELEMKRAGLDKEYEMVSRAYNMRDSLMQKLVDLGVVSKSNVDSHWGTYLKQTYDEYLTSAGSGLNKSGIGLKSQGRVDGLSAEKLAELGQVENASVVWGATLLKQIDLVKKAELQKFTSDGYALTEDMLQEYQSKGGKLSDLYKIPDSSAYSLKGRTFDVHKKLADVRTQIKDVLKQRKLSVADDKELTRTIDGLMKQMDNLKGATEEQVGEALSGIKQVLRESSIKEGPLKKAPTSMGQKAIADPLRTWLNRGTKSDRLARETMSTIDLLKEYRATTNGIGLDRAFEDPRMMYQWSSPREFVDSIRYPDRATVLSSDANHISDLTDAQQLTRIKHAEKNARKFGEVEQTKKILEGTNLKLVRESVDRLEQEYADLLWKKSGVLDELSTLKHGELAGKYVSNEVWNSLKGTFDPTREVGQSLVMAFKHAKVIWNPASQVRNAFSAGIQNWWKLGLGPWNVQTYYSAFQEFKTPGGGKFLNQMKEMGFNEQSGYIRELIDNYVTNKELMRKSFTQQMGSVNAVRKFGKHIDNALMNSYGHVDNVAKVAAYKNGIEKGLGKEEAFAQAMAATFNYSQVTPFVHQMRRAIWGVPFVTFALKAVPLAAETIAKNPGRVSVFGKARNDLFKAAGVEGQQESESMPAYMRDDQFMMRLPWKDEKGRSMYFDLSYIIPFGSLLDGSYLKNPMSANPILQTVSSLSTNKTFSGNKVFNESDDISTVLADVGAYVTKMFLPPAATDFLSDGYKSDGTRIPAKMGWNKYANIDTQDLGPGERTFYQDVFKQLGLSATPYELNSKESALAYKQKENLSQLLTEHGVTKTYQSTYLPKDSDLRLENQGFNPDSITSRDVQPIGR